jgi:hypothetical protein
MSPDDTAYLVYDADGTILGEVTYMVRKWLGLGKCDLCDVTHAGVRRRPAWVEAAAGLEVNVRALHRDELDTDVRTFIDGAFPSVVGRRSGTLGWILRPEEIGAYVGDPRRLADTIAAYFGEAGR